MTKFTIIPKRVKVLQIVYSKQCWNGYCDKTVRPHKRFTIGKYFVAEHGNTPGLNKGDAFIIDEIVQD